MKSIYLTKLGLLILAVMLCLGSCEESEVVPGNPNPPPPSPPAGPTTADEITEDLLFDNIKILEGAIPTPSNTVFDFKIDTDTIFWVPGIDKSIRLLKPENFGSRSGTFYAQVEGSDQYIEADFNQDMETDTIVFLNFEFDVTSWDLPLSFNLKIVPRDESGNPVDEIDVPVDIEAPATSSGCIDLSGSLWEWIYTTTNGDYFLSPMAIVKQDGVTSACCDNLGATYLPCDSQDPNLTEMAFEITYTVATDYFELDDDGNVSGRMEEYSTNLDIINSDVCANQPALEERVVNNRFSGTYTQNNSCEFVIDDLSGESEQIYLNGVFLGEVPFPIYVGSGPLVNYTVLSNHFIKETRILEGGSLERVYERRDRTTFLSFKWFD